MELASQAKHYLGTTLKPKFFEDALHFASTGLFDEYYGNTKEYRPGQPLPRVAYQITTAVTDALHPFLREVIFGRDAQAIQLGRKVVGQQGETAEYRRLGGDGRFSLPANWVHPTSMHVPGAVESPEILDDNEVETVLNSVIDFPTLQNPKLEIVPNGMILHPAGCPELRAKYLGKPRRAVYVVNYVNDEMVYDDVASVDTEWPESRHNQLLTRMLHYPGLALRDAQVQQTAQALTDRGA